MTNYERGQRYENKTRLELIAQGYRVVKQKGSKGPVDLLAWNEKQYKMVQAKAPHSRMTEEERETFLKMPCPPNTVKEAWFWTSPTTYEVEMLTRIRHETRLP